MAKKKKAVQSKKPVQQNTEPKRKFLEKQEPSKAELMIFRIGMIVISVAVLAFAVILVVNYIFNQEEDAPYEDYLHITNTELDQIVSDNGDKTFGDISYFYGVDDYAYLLSLLNTNDIIYFYFYHSESEDFDEDIQAAIIDNTDIGLIPTETLMEDNDNEQFVAFIFIDLDDASNAEIFSDDVLTYLELDSDLEQFILTFDQYNPDDEFFTIEDDVDDIIDMINAL